MENSIVKGLRQNSIQCSDHKGPVVDLHFSGLLTNDTYYMISASKDGIPMLRFGPTGDWIGSFRGHKGAVWSCTLSGDGKRAASGAADYTARVWDCETGAVVRTIKHDDIVRCVEFSGARGGGELLVTASDKLMVHDLRCEQGAGGWPKLAGHTDTVHRAFWLGDDDTHVLSVSADSTIRLWDRRVNQESWKLNVGSTIYDMDLVVTSDGASKAILACGKKVSIWDVNTHNNGGGEVPMTVTKQVAMDLPTFSASLHQSMGAFVCAGDDFLIRRYRLYGDGGLEHEIVESCEGHTDSVHRVRYSPDGHLFASGSEDGTLRLWQNEPDESYGLSTLFLEPSTNEQPQHPQSIVWAKKKWPGYDFCTTTEYNSLLNAFQQGLKARILDYSHIKGIDGSKRSPIHIAIADGHLPVLRHLIFKGARLDVPNRESLYPLHLAVRKRNLEMVRSLVDAGAPVDSEDKGRKTPMAYAFYIGEAPICWLLMSHAATVDMCGEQSVCAHSIQQREGLDECAALVEIVAKREDCIATMGFDEEFVMRCIRCGVEGRFALCCGHVCCETCADALQGKKCLRCDFIVDGKLKIFF